MWQNLNHTYYQTDKVKIYNGDSLAILKTLPDESIDCVITSPPYWALRDYQLSPQVWDGDGKCEHRWGDKIMPLGSKSGKPGPNATVGARFAQDEYRRGQGTNFCSLCDAWRGSLGLEPTFELYLKHLLQIFDEIRRILKPTGTCFVNLGDSYGGSGNRKGHTPETSNLNRLTVGYGATEGNQKATKGLEKSLCLIPQRFAIGMVDSNWVLREDLTKEEKEYVLTELIKRDII